MCKIGFIVGDKIKTGQFLELHLQSPRLRNLPQFTIMNIWQSL